MLRSLNPEPNFMESLNCLLPTQLLSIDRIPFRDFFFSFVFLRAFLLVSVQRGTVTLDHAFKAMF